MLYFQFIVVLFRKEVRLKLCYVYPYKRHQFVRIQEDNAHAHTSSLTATWVWINFNYLGTRSSKIYIILTHLTYNLILSYLQKKLKEFCFEHTIILKIYITYLHTFSHICIYGYKFNPKFAILLTITALPVFQKKLNHWMNEYQVIPHLVLGFCFSSN